MEIFPEWHPDLNKKHFPRSADSEYVAVLAGQRSDGVIVPINVSLIDGTTDQYALASNTEIALPPITIGKVIIQGVDSLGTKHDLLATPNPDGTWNLSLTSPTLALEASQLTQIDLILQGLVLASQQVAQMSDLITTVATEATQLSVLQELKGLCFNAPSLNQEITQLSILHEMEHLSISVGDIQVDTTSLEDLSRIQISTTATGFTDVLLGLTDIKILELHQITQLSDLEARVSTEVTQLSILYDLQGLCFNFSSTTLNQEVTQLSVLQELQGLCFNAPSLNQEVTQLSILAAMDGLSVSVGDVNVNTDELETLTRIQTATIAEGLTNVLALEAQEVTQLSDLQMRLATEQTQLSIFQELSGLCVNLDSTSLAQEVTQLSILYDLEGLCFNFSSTTLNQEVTQLSVLQTLEGLSITTAAPHGKYYAFETTQPAGLTDVTYNFGVRMQDVYFATSNPVAVKFGSISNPAINLANGRFTFEEQNTDMMFVTTSTIPVDLQIYANGGTA